MKSHSVRYLRIALAVLSCLAFVVLFADFTGFAASHLAFLAKIQVWPAILAVNIGAIVFLAALTLIFGRLYCSVLCPYGIMQDAFAWLRRRFGKKQKKRLGFYRFSPERKKWRYAFLTMAIVLSLGAAFALLPMSLAGILDPYSFFGRIASQTTTPAWRAASGAIADAEAEKGVYLFDSVPSATATLSIAVGIVALASLIIVAIFAWRSGRGYCNTVCPIGTLLGFLSRFSLLKPMIDTDRCNRCGSCGRHCKASCIDTKKHVIDYSRCVVCFDCINNCTQGAISYSFRRRKDEKATEVSGDVKSETKASNQKMPDDARRAFLVGSAIVAGAAVASASDKLTDGGLAPIKKKQPRKGIHPVVPPGARSIRHFRSHCTACQLCVSECPNEVLRPGTSLEGLMQPVMAFTAGFCRPECTRCSEVCPTGAIEPIDTSEKVLTAIGIARVDIGICISAAYGQTCGNCVRHCPASAISMVKGANGHMRPVVDESRCIGCGSCEYHCPSGTAGQLSATHAAIYVEGFDTHRI